MSEIRFGGRCEKHLSIKPCQQCYEERQHDALEEGRPYGIMTDQDKAVALAEKHGAAKVVGFISNQIHMRVDDFVAMLAEHDRQHSEELAKKAAPNVAPWNEVMRTADFYNGIPMQLVQPAQAMQGEIKGLRDALTTMQARVEQMGRDLKFQTEMASSFKDDRAQAQTRVAELEKDAARVREMLRQLEITSSGMSYGDDKRGGASDYTRGWKDCLAAFKRETLAAKQTDFAIDAAMKGQQP